MIDDKWIALQIRGECLSIHEIDFLHKQRRNFPVSLHMCLSTTKVWYRECMLYVVSCIYTGHRRIMQCQIKDFNCCNRLHDSTEIMFNKPGVVV